MPVCIVVGAGAVELELPAAKAGEFVIAADGGVKALENRGLRWDLALGDFDSLGRVPEGGEVLRYPAEKDETDMHLALREGFARGYRRFVIYGGLGGRLDHSLANLQLLRGLAEQGGRGFLVSADTVATAVTDGALYFGPDMRGTVSVLCAGDRAEGVTLTGLRYPLTDAVLTGGVPLGMSNEFTGVPACVSVFGGTLWVLWQENARALLTRLRAEEEA